ncbi:MAG: hypothetical protein ACTHU0_01395 [Kofleriaceae bacterium]
MATNRRRKKQIAALAKKVRTIDGAIDAVALTNGGRLGLFEGEQKRKKEAAEKRARARLKAFQTTKMLTGKAFGGATSAGSAVGIENIGSVSEMVGEVFQFEKSLTRFQIASKKSAPAMAKLRQNILDVSKQTGVGSGQILAGAQTYLDLTNDVGGAEAALGSFARVAQASGASVTDVAKASAAMRASGNVGDGEMEKAWSGLIASGGNVQELAGEMPALMSAMGGLGNGTGVNAIRDMGAALQVLRSGGSSTADASKDLQSLMGSLTKNAPKLKAIGVDAFQWNAMTQTHELRSLHDIVRQIAKQPVDPAKLGKLLGADQGGLQAISLLTEQIGLYDQLTVAAQNTGAVQRNLDIHLSSSSGKLETAFAQIKATLAEALTPERVAVFTTGLVKAVEAASWMLNKLEALAKFIRGKTYEEGGRDRANQLVEDARGLTRAQKTERGRQYLEKFKDLYNAPDTGNPIVDFYNSVEMEKYRLAGYELQAQGDLWDGGTHSRATFEPARFEATLRDALSKITVVVQADGNGIAKTVDNAPRQRTPKAPR